MRKYFYIFIIIIFFTPNLANSVNNIGFEEKMEKIRIDKENELRILRKEVFKKIELMDSKGISGEERDSILKTAAQSQKDMEDRYDSLELDELNKKKKTLRENYISIIVNKEKE